MFDFECIVARNLDDCLRALAEYSIDGTLLAGGTDLYVLMKTGTRMPRVVIYIGNVPDLKEAGAGGDEVTIGPGLSHEELSCHPVTREIACLRLAAQAIGSPQIRNMGTTGGNLANASPAADLYPPLLVLDAELDLRSLRGARQISLRDFVTGPGMTAIQAEEIISQVRFRIPAGRFYSGFKKVGLRNALAISVASAAVLATGENGRFKEMRIACGAVAPMPVRMTKTEALLRGQVPSDHLLEEVEEVVRSECDPITDIRATKDYRKHVAGVLVSRLVEEAWNELSADKQESRKDA